MRRVFPVLVLLLLLAGCAENAPAAPASSEAQAAAVWSAVPLGPGSTLTEQGFYSTEAVAEGGRAVLTFYDFAAMAQRVACSVPGCAHDGDACPAWGAGSHLFRLGGTLLALGGSADEDYETIFLRRYDAEDGRLLDTRTVLAGWELAGAFTDGQFLYGCIEGDLLRIDPATGLETVARRNFPANALLLGALDGRIVWQRADPDQPDRQVLYRMEDDFSLTEFFRFDPAQIQPLCMDGARLYWADSATGQVCATDGQGDTRTVSEALAPFVWTRAEDGWCSVQGWGGQAVGGKLLVDVLADPEDLSVTCLAVDLATGEAAPCPLTDYWNGYAHPVAVWAETDRGLLVSQHERVMRTALGQDGGFSTYESDRTLYGFIDGADFFAGRPQYRMIASIAI